MAATFWQSFLRVTETVQLAEDQRLSLSGSGSASFLPQEAVILSDGIPLDSFDAQAYNTAELNSRTLFSNALQSFGGELAACFAELAKVISPTGTSTGGVPQTQPTQVLPVLYQFMASAAASPSGAGFENAPIVNSRNLTYGAPSYGSANVGTGLLKRLTVDAYGYNLEGGFAETLTMTCTADAQSGTITGQEQFSILGQPFRDALSWFSSGFGSGLQAAASKGLVGVTADTTAALVQNSSFSQGTGTPFSSWVVTGWTQTSGSAAALGIDATNFYRAAQIEGTTPASLQSDSSATITQAISANAGSLQITAYLNQLAVDFSLGSGTGSVTVQIGAKSWTVNSGVSGWNLLLPTLNKNLWFTNFEEANLAVTITITKTGGTSIHVDDFCWSPMTEQGNTLFWLIGGQTAFLVNDSIQTVDAEPSTPSKVQNWIRLMFPGYFLPSAVQPVAPTTAATLSLGAAGAVTNGAHLCYVSFFNNSTGVESALGPASQVIVVAANDRISWANIPTSGALFRNLYRTRANALGNSTPYFVAQIADNSTTTFSDNVADAALLLQNGSVADPVI